MPPAAAVLRPELTEEFLQRVDQPLQTRVDSLTKRRYILCDYNRDGDSYRSPWSNAYEPAIPPEDGEGFVPSKGLRELEVAANEVREGLVVLPELGAATACRRDTDLRRLPRAVL